MQFSGQNGHSNTFDDIVFDHKIQETTTLIYQYAPTFTDYFENRVVPMLKENKSAHKKYPSNVQPNWTNNACESLNAVIKRHLDWRPQTMTELADKLYELVLGQFTKLKRALVGQGDFRLNGQFIKCQVPVLAWCQKTTPQRETLFQRFLTKPCLTNARLTFSTDNQRLVLTPTANGGKKPGEIKRKRCAKTTSIPNKKIINDNIYTSPNGKKTDSFVIDSIVDLLYVL